MRFANEVNTVLRTVYIRITLTRYTTLFFLLSILHCLLQGVVQALLYSADADSSALISAILHKAELAHFHELPWLHRPHADNGSPAYVLSSCPSVPMYENKDSCNLVFDSRLPPEAPLDMRAGTNGTIPANTGVAHTNFVAHFTGNGAVDGILLFNKDTVATMNNQCIHTLVYVDQVLKNTKRERLTVLASQFWLFIMSFYALMYESIPHILAAFASRLLLTGWAAYSVWRTDDIHKRFTGLITGTNTPCQLNLFPDYFERRSSAEAPDLFLNCLTLVLSIYVSYKLVKLYNMHTLQRICPTAEVLRLYRFFMGASACLHLSIFFLFSAMGLWIDQLINGAISRISTHTPIYVALFVFTTIILVPWLYLGRAAIARESLPLLWTFQAIAFVLTACWAIMFYSRVFRWTFIQWPFFGCVVVASFIGIVMAAGWAEVGRRGFGYGLRHFLHVNEELSRLGFEPEVFVHAPRLEVVVDVDVKTVGLDHGVPLKSLYKGKPPEAFLPQYYKSS